MILSALTYVYRNHQAKVGKTKSSLTLFMAKDQLKYSAKHAKFAAHFSEVVDRLAEIKSMDVFPILRWLRLAEEKWELALHFLWALRRAQKSESAVDLFQLREFILHRGYESCYLTEPPINGTFLTKKGIKGPAIRETLENAVLWRVVNP